MNGWTKYTAYILFGLSLIGGAVAKFYSHDTRITVLEVKTATIEKMAGDVSDIKAALVPRRPTRR